jgi:hypothetical protein
MPSQVSPICNLLNYNTSMWNFMPSRGFTKFHIRKMSVKPVNLGEITQVSHGGSMTQIVMNRWNLWRLLSISLRKYSPCVRCTNIKANLKNALVFDLKRLSVLVEMPKCFLKRQKLDKTKRGRIIRYALVHVRLSDYLPAFFTYFSNQASSSYKRWRMFSLAE